MNNKNIVYDATLWDPEFEYAPQYDYGRNFGTNDNIKAIFFKSVCEGKKTKVFGYLGIPACVEKKVPAVVLVHGGGGTAFDDWVKMWTDRGYAALALDTEGNVPVPENKMDCQEHPASGFFGKPNARFQDTCDDINDTWMHYASSSVIAAANLLKSLDCVDENKVGICGISWGGVITMLTTCRYEFAFSVPIYLAMHVKESGVSVAVNYNTECADIWEASPIKNVKSPMLFIGDIYDVCTSVSALSQCAEDTAGSAFLSFQAGFGHGHLVGAQRTESLRFADYIVKGGKEPAVFTGRPEKSGKVRFDPKGNKIVEATVRWCDKTRSVDKEDWHEAKAVISDGYISADIPSGCKLFFFSVKDESGDTFSSMTREI